ncbi:hypothetical protein KSP40_PGU018754 [Platanthera guangdongensis]|uniref:Uncharacterized protein n=1 Tax=Platanthera guangdongensis TaxID=2320717 RepID=A0ABR2LV12_9ASPA
MTSSHELSPLHGPVPTPSSRLPCELALLKAQYQTEDDACKLRAKSATRGGDGCFYMSFSYTLPRMCTPAECRAYCNVWNTRIGRAHPGCQVTQRGCDAEGATCRCEICPLDQPPGAPMRSMLDASKKLRHPNQRQTTVVEMG